ncbi:hypothetical protein, partial [Streptomyces sp. PTY087I2]|uniref:hypothetical protein n=1 Tax=Streptomyces sp. PTY087I2 TaxID=1819298 RepID=UPI001C400DE1
MAIDSMGNIYATDYYNQKVWRVKSGGDGSLEVFATLPDRVAHLALDDEADCAYITTPDALWKVAGLHDTVDSTQKKLVASIPGAIGVTLDTARRFGYVTANGALLRVALDGQPGTNTTEVARIETDEIGDVALDGNRENAYVTDVKGGSLFKINLEKETSIKVGENLGNPMGVTLDDLGNAYVTSGK